MVGFAVENVNVRRVQAMVNYYEISLGLHERSSFFFTPLYDAGGGGNPKSNSIGYQVNPAATLAAIIVSDAVCSR